MGVISYFSIRTPNNDEKTNCRWIDMIDESEWDPGSEYFEQEEAAIKELDDNGMRSRKIYSVNSSNSVCTVDTNLR